MAKVLVIDDAIFMRQVLKGILSKDGHEVVGEAGDGNEGFEKYKQVKPDLVTLDITMPDCDGIECLKKIRDFDPGANVIMCSAMGQHSKVMDAIQAGARDFIVKPFEPEKVLAAIKQILDN